MAYLSQDEEQAVIELRPMAGFVETPYIKDLTYRAMNYIKAGFPVHLRGVSGTGKTTLALHVAQKIGRPAVLIHGDEDYSTSDLIGGESGYRFRKLRDNFISSVLKEEEDYSKRWMDNRLTIAVKNGFTLIYDEFTRSRPEANNTLLSILQEGVMDLPLERQGRESHYLKAHPQFVAIFTSNPEEYAGTHKAQDALRDRMVTLDVRHFDKNTEMAITQAKSGMPREDVEKIVTIVRALRDSGEYEFTPTIRGSIMLAKSLQTAGEGVSSSSRLFRQLAQDILASETTRLGSLEHHAKVKKIIGELITKHC